MMLEESMSTVPSPSIWSSIFSWFTPTVFFVFVNLTIGTIFFTSTFSSNNPSVGEGQPLHEGDESKTDPKPVRSEEPVSFTATTQDSSGDVHFSFHQRTTPEQTPTHPPPTQQQQEEEEGDQEPQVPKEVQDEATQGEERGFDGIHSEPPKGNSEVTRTKSDVDPASGQLPIKLARKMRKSASVKSPFSHFEEDKILEARRPASVREIRKGKASEEDDEVDAKADDFINKFKQQLKLENFI